VTQALDGDRARLTVVGELTEPARRPLIRALTDLLLQEASLRRVELDLRGVEFMNSAGLAVLVQMMRLGAPRGIPVVLVEPPPAVTKPLRLSGLWYRFEVIDGDDPSTGP
jgi:anti-anti-sigma factor